MYRHHKLDQFAMCLHRRCLSRIFQSFISCTSETVMPILINPAVYTGLVTTHILLTVYVCNHDLKHILKPQAYFCACNYSNCVLGSEALPNESCVDTDGAQKLQLALLMLHLQCRHSVSVATVCFQVWKIPACPIDTRRIWEDDVVPFCVVFGFLFYVWYFLLTQFGF